MNLDSLVKWCEINEKEDQNGSFILISNKDRRIPNPDLSVIMSVFNGNPYLDESISSILNQTMKNFEFIILNDGSSDGSDANIINAMRNDSRIKLIHQNNIGLTKSLNRGIRVASSTYIARQDADDISHPGRFDSMLRFAREHGGNIFGCDYDILFNGNVTKRIISNRYWIKYRMLVSNQFAHGSLVARKSFLESLGMYDEALPCSQDYDLLMRAFSRDSQSVVVVPGVFYRLRKHPMSISSQKKKLQSKIAWGIRFHFMKNLFKIISNSKMRTRIGS